jgi:TatD DNase family protein
MPHDAHCHPYDLMLDFLHAENTRTELGIPIAASAWNAEDFSFNKALSLSAPPEAPVALTFGAHPQMSAAKNHTLINKIPASLELLETLCRENALAAIGECGYDLFDDDYRAAEKTQDEIFQVHLDAAIKYSLPLVLHIRKAMHKIFENNNISKLKKCRAVVFHSYSGANEEAHSILRHGVNAYFSFSSIICNNHKKAVETCISLPPQRILFETDAPYQPLQGNEFSSYRDILVTLKYAAKLKNLPEKELAEITDSTFCKIFFPEKKHE